MKVINGESVAVQQKDLDLLLKAKKIEEIPSTVLDSIKNNNSTDKTEFVEFNGKDTVNFFNSLDYIIDYSNFKYLTWAETLDLSRDTIRELNAAYKKFDSLDSNSSCEEVLNARNRLDLMKYKMDSIKTLIEAKKANIMIGTIDSPKEGHFRRLSKSIQNHKSRK